MTNSRRKHLIMLMLIGLIAICSTLLMLKRNNEPDITTIAVVLPQKETIATSRIMDGIRDYVLNNSIELDVLYVEEITEDDMNQILSEETKNNAIGTIIIYPEKYLKCDEDYRLISENIIAITEFMQNQFGVCAYFSNSSKEKEVYDAPLSTEIFQEIINGIITYIHLNNTYALGYKTIEMMDLNGKKGKLSNVEIKSVKVDKQVIESGDFDELLVE
ncbi:hypothetical protein [Anaerosacchariphilus polymeriproducens]|uniref:Uncharacterized protein n=1 Tax=Anaerosacchariphilus polymeriproducens TaxID=1812858 RepID=A0A371AVT0_9FIRM|nr:hypothetical protein [Anaerosacchariphilus polymeriproducens]RDU23694.1 hypothetical protein DWV06_07485 [Anaerosacchariphilus polymeriproducens]